MQYVLALDQGTTGQALTVKNETVRAELEQAAREDHLAWCETRINALGGRMSLLNPLWFGGAFGIGVVAGLLGDKWNLGFLAETERQVEAHLDATCKNCRKPTSGAGRWSNR